MPTRVDFKRIKAGVRFETILDHYGLKLERKGAELVGLCPFHKETRPSFRVNTTKGGGVFNCFGCGAGGDVLAFVARKEETTLREAAALIAEWCHLGSSITPVSGNTEIATPLEKSSPRGAQTPASTPAPAEIGKPDDGAVNSPLTFTLKLERDHPYLASRGLAAETLEAFGVGYCARGILKGRIAIPIRNVAGELIAYAGRWPAEDPPANEEKYRLTPRFKKSHVLFNLERVKHAEELIIVEGYFGVMRLHELELPAVALMGRTMSTSLRRPQAC